jgi:DNA-binding NtrC family response regulator
MEEITGSRQLLRRTILVVEEDNNARPSLTRNLRQFGYRLLVAASVEDAHEWVSCRDHVHADLLLIDLVGRVPEEALVIGQHLRAAGHYHGRTPLVIMPEGVAQDVEGSDKNVSANDWICYYEDADQLQRLLVRLLE